MVSLMDEISELIYVSDLDTHELLYINKAGRNMLGIDELNGQKCYRVLQNKDAPCTFCTNSYLQKNHFYNWQFFNSVVRRHFLLKDKLIDWEGRPARVEIAFDVTESEQKKQELKNSLDAENLVTACSKRLFAAPHVGTALDDVLGMVGRFLESDRAYIFQVNGDIMSNTFEWCANGVTPQKDALKEMPVSLLERWQVPFQRQECVVIEDIGRLREISPEEYEVLRQQEINSLIAAPMYWEKNLIGYVGVDNYSSEKFKNVAAVLSSIGFFVGYVLRHEETLRQLRKLSYHDTLTGMLNRNAFMRDIETLEDAVTTSVGVIYADINGMKELNDQLGHREGDMVLKDASERILSLFPAECCYRIGGDEFVAICSNVEEQAFAHRVQDLVNLFGCTEKYTVSVGARWSPNYSDIQTLIFEADEQMYMDKKNFYYGKALSGRYRHNLDDILGLTQPGTLQAFLDEGRFLIYYQPKVSAKTGDLIGAEALVRYRSPAGKILSPAQFIPLLEEARLIGLVDFYIFDKVCAQIAGWIARGVPAVPVSTNFSRHSLSGDFPGRLSEIWKTYGIPMDYIEIEVTETVEADSDFLFMETIRQIKEKGFKVAIDDFGARFANLSLFTMMDFDVLKIDKSLIDTITYNEKAQSVLSSIVDISHKMHTSLIAEGVETEEQRQILCRIGFDGLQGYLFSKPVPIDIFEQAFFPKK